MVGFAGGCLIGLLAIRIRATYLGPVTLCVAVAFPMIVKRFAWMTGGSSGLPLHPTGCSRRPGCRSASPTSGSTSSWWPSPSSPSLRARSLSRSAVGLAVRAVAENPLSAAAYGINVRRYRVTSAGVGAAFGALGGALLVFDTPIVGADSYDLFRSLGYYAAVVVGGVTSLLGGVFGAAIVAGVPFIIGTYGLLVGPNLVFGLLLIGATFVAPGGIAAAVIDWLRWLVRVEEPVPTPTRPVRRLEPTREPLGGGADVSGSGRP